MPATPANLIKRTSAVSAEYAGIKRTCMPRRLLTVQE